MKICLACGVAYAEPGWRCPECLHLPAFDGAIPLFAPALAEENSGFRAEYFDELERLEGKNFWFRVRNALIISTLWKFCPDMRKFMELGCGTGFVMKAIASAFPCAAITGTEVFSKGLTHAATRVPRAALIQADARNLPYVAHFDVIGAFDVLEHIEHDEQVLNQIYKSLKPDGFLFLSVPQHPWLWSKQDELAHHVRRYSASELRVKLIAAGFTILHARSFVTLLLPALWITRRRSSAAQRSDALLELRSGERLNKVLGYVMQLEFFLHRVGVRIPLGGSLFMVAQKPSL